MLHYRSGRLIIVNCAPAPPPPSYQPSAPISLSLSLSLSHRVQVHTNRREQRLADCPVVDSESTLHPSNIDVGQHNPPIIRSQNWASTFLNLSCPRLRSSTKDRVGSLAYLHRPAVLYWWLLSAEVLASSNLIWSVNSVVNSQSRQGCFSIYSLSA